MSSRVEMVAVEALRDWLLMKLPAKVAAVNAERAAVLKAAKAGPYTIASGATLKIGSTIGSEETETLTSGTRTAAQVAADISVSGITASADDDGRLILTATTAPTSGNSVVSVGQYASTEANSVFGWDLGGERVVRTPLIAPSRRGVSDGWPITPELGPGFWVVIGDRETEADDNIKRDMHSVGLELVILRAERQMSHNDREAIAACLRCVREVLLTDSGRTLGRPSIVTLVKETGASISGRPFQFESSSAANPLMDVATINLLLRIYERPDAS